MWTQSAVCHTLRFFETAGLLGSTHLTCTYMNSEVSIQSTSTYKAFPCTLRSYTA